MSKSLKPIAIAAGTLALAGTAFAMSSLPQGYMLGAQQASTEATAKHGEGKCGIEHMDTDKDGKISKAEFAAAHDGKDDKFAAHDGNGDGMIDAAELDAHHAAKKAKAAEGKCGEGKCGAEMKQPEKKAEAKAEAMEGKCGEGKCGGAL